MKFRFAILLFAFIFSSCANHSTRNESDGMADEIKARNESLIHAVQSYNGHAWVTVEMTKPKEKISFLAEVTGQLAGRLELNAQDPFGVTHHRITVTGESFLWEDLDHHERRTAQGNWKGLPVNWLPKALIGILPFEDCQKIQCEMKSSHLPDGNLPVVDEWTVKSEKIVNGVVVSYVKFQRWPFHEGQEKLVLPRDIGLTTDELKIGIRWRDLELSGAGDTFFKERAP